MLGILLWALLLQVCNQTQGRANNMSEEWIWLRPTAGMKTKLVTGLTENKERQKHSRSQQNYKVLSGGFTTPWSHSWLFLEPDRQVSQCLETYDYNCLHPMLVELSWGWSDRLKDTTLLQASQTTSDLKLQRPCLRHQLRPWHKSLP